MYDKYRQINRFLEVLDDEIGKLGREREKQHMLPPLGPAVDLKEMPLYQLGAPPGQVFQRQRDGR